MLWIETFDPQMRADLHTLYCAEWWTEGRTREDVDHVLNHSQLTVGRLDERGRLSAFARVLTDFRFKAIVFDVIVRRDRRGEGLGEAIMRRIEEHPALAEVQTFELYCQEGTVEFYRRLGYGPGSATRLLKSRGLPSS